MEDFLLDLFKRHYFFTLKKAIWLVNPLPQNERVLESDSNQFEKAVLVLKFLRKGVLHYFSFVRFLSLQGKQR